MAQLFMVVETKPDKGWTELGPNLPFESRYPVLSYRRLIDSHCCQMGIGSCLYYLVLLVGELFFFACLLCQPGNITLQHNYLQPCG